MSCTPLKSAPALGLPTESEPRVSGAASNRVSSSCSVIESAAGSGAEALGRARVLAKAPDRGHGCNQRRHGGCRAVGALVEGSSVGGPSSGWGRQLARP